MALVRFFCFARLIVERRSMIFVDFTKILINFPRPAAKLKEIR